MKQLNTFTFFFLYIPRYTLLCCLPWIGLNPTFLILFWFKFSVISSLLYIFSVVWELWLIKVCYIAPAETNCLDILFFHSYTFCLDWLVKQIHTISPMDWAMIFNVNIMYVIILFALHVLFNQDSVVYQTAVPCMFSHWCFFQRSDTCIIMPIRVKEPEEITCFNLPAQQLVL